MVHSYDSVYDLGFCAFIEKGKRYLTLYLGG